MENYEEFQNFNFLSHNIDFINEFKIIDKDNENQDMLNYYFIPLDSEDIYRRFMEEFKFFDSCRRNKFPLTEITKMAYYIKTNGIDMFVAMSLNKIISNLGLKNISQQKKNNYHNLSTFTKNLITNYYKFKSPNMNDLLSLFFDENVYTSKMKPKFMKGKNINQKLFEIILHSYRYCVQTL